MERWEDLQCRLFHLGYLGEELEYFAGTSHGAWLYRQIAQEAARAAEVAREYAGEVEQASTYYADGGL
ncbi:hypothetical protein [Actinokineospora globicatena]|uniref:hypothetical protein n=1 Tax=Actinokineospora globicatena TaxID=103729 RepID=UPI0020A3BDA5|nr:hypothetical protein [Actinokineospora globicatena]MCP2303219.1 hypothetical protein [Actinokineospora globicatena]GLW79658.1 hypothetical protein Aglo01_41390 [Actinokineospora globicatena]GLW85932.1 hypothetical protein Aglo02_35720 [Actinokineospora globicatena]